MVSLDGSVFPQTVIAVIWDFDKTLIPGYMQTPLFERYGVDEERFWKEVNALPAFYEKHGYPLFPRDIGYLSHILTYVREGQFKGLNNRMLRELGGELKFYPGLPSFFTKLKKHIEDNERFAKHDITLEHYIASTGLHQMIRGSKIAKYVDGIWACELLGVTAGPGFLSSPQQDYSNADEAELRAIAYAIDNTTKTRAVFEINKGVNRYPNEITVNDKMPPEARRVPIEHMIYIADGPSDVPAFSILNQAGGKTFAVYSPDASEQEFRQVRGLQDQGRVMSFGSADYRQGTHTYRCLMSWADEIAERIATHWQQKLGEHIGKPPEHIVPSVDGHTPQPLASN